MDADLHGNAVEKPRRRSRFEQLMGPYEPGLHFRKRSDEDVAQAAMHALKNHCADLDGMVSVTALAGHVSLSGRAMLQAQKDAAARCIACLMGVISVTNLITVESPSRPGS